MFASPARTPRSPRSERRTAAWPTSHAVIIGLLVYIAAFQGILRVFQGRGAIDPLNRTYNERIRDIPNLKDLPPVKLPLQNTTPANFHPFPWRRQSPKEIKVPYPIFVTSLPKTGTTSVFKYFRCGGVRSSHTFINKPGAAKSMLAGKCMHENIVKGNPPFEGCGTTDLFSDTGFIDYDHDTGLQCFFPSIDGLQAIYNAYPKATFVNTIRSTDDWYKSLKAWGEGSLLIRMRLCNATNFPTGQSTRQDFLLFYEWHNAMIRQFVADRPSLTYLEIALESQETGALLEDRTGIAATCWRKCLPDSPRCEEKSTARRRKKGKG